LGFLGSVVQLAFSIFLIQNFKMFGIADIGEATRISFLLVAVWWVGFAQIAFFILPKPLPKEHKEKNLMRKGFEELGKVWKSLQKMPNTMLFLLAFFFYCMGAQSIFLLATLFGSEELKLGQDKLIPTILGLQLVGILGAYLFAYISKKKGNKFALLCILFFWLVLGVYGYFVTTETQFYIMAITFGVAMGGYHLSRSTYAKLIPQNTQDSTSYFSFYDVVEKMATAFGPFLYGLIEALTGSMRNSIIALGVYFLIAIILLSFVKVEAGKESA
jgi:UMF1 family MFS transporter